MQQRIEIAHGQRVVDVVDVEKIFRGQGPAGSDQARQQRERKSGSLRYKQMVPRRNCTALPLMLTRSPRSSHHSSPPRRET